MCDNHHILGKNHQNDYKSLSLMADLFLKNIGFSQNMKKNHPFWHPLLHFWKTRTWNQTRLFENQNPKKPASSKPNPSFEITTYFQGHIQSFNYKIGQTTISTSGVDQRRLWRIGIQIRNIRNIYGTWRWVMFKKQMMKNYDFFYSA